MLTITEIQLVTSVKEIVSHSGVRANCNMCDEEIMNEREILRVGSVLYQNCAGHGCYQLNITICFKNQLVAHN